MHLNRVKRVRKFLRHSTTFIPRLVIYNRLIAITTMNKIINFEKKKKVVETSGNFIYLSTTISDRGNISFSFIFQGVKTCQSAHKIVLELEGSLINASGSTWCFHRSLKTVKKLSSQTASGGKGRGNDCVSRYGTRNFIFSLLFFPPSLLLFLSYLFPWYFY